MSSEEKKIVLNPSHKSIFLWYLLALMLVPLFGIGIYLFYRFYSAHISIKYVITDRSITLKDSKTTENVDLANVHQTETEQRWIDKKFGIGDVIIRTGNRTVRMIGQEKPYRLADLILQAAQSERNRLETTFKEPRPEPEHSPGTLDKLDYLTGLWQQGLLSDEDYRKEKKHFE